MKLSLPRGKLSIDEFYQALYEGRHSFFEKHNIRHLKRPVLYFQPVDEDGEPVTIKGHDGKSVTGGRIGRPYNAAADHYAPKPR